jgi:hypothetical protein
MTATTDNNDDDAGGAVPRPLRDGIDTVRAQAADAAELARENAVKALEAAKDGIEQARETLNDAYASSRDRAVGVYSTTRERANDAYAAARERAKLAGDTAAGRLDANPIVALLGGLVVGVALGALLPRTERETKVLGGVGGRLNDLAQEALNAAKDAGQAKLADLGLTQENAREQIHALIDGALAAATSAGTAAVDTARAQAQGKTVTH